MAACWPATRPTPATWPQGRSVSSAAVSAHASWDASSVAELEFEPRRRQDIDIVFMAAFPAGARQLMPQLAFHHGADLPVHATSHVWSGVPDPANDRDLDGVVFGDMPWLAAPTER